MSKNEKLINEVLKASQEKEGRLYIKCIDALKIAEQFKVKPIEVGIICNKKKIKIKNCQLGCF
ncbi:MAG: hypothetical protein ABII90_05725 [Bacteroidota bacterium]